MRLTLLTLALLFLFGGPARADLVPRGWNEDKTPDTTRWTLNYAPASDDYRSGVGREYCLLVHVRSGDIVNVVSENMYANPNNTAAQYWTIGGKQSEHWSLWVMQGNVVQAGTSCDDRHWYVSYWQDENFDNYMHYFDANRFAEWKVPDLGDTAIHDIYISSWAYFVASKYYVIGQPSVTLDTSASKLQVLVFNQVP